jgi:acetyl-CoA acetyltransferase
MSKDAYIIGSYSTQFKKWPEKSFRDLSRDAVLGALEDAGMDSGEELEFVWFGHTGTGGWGPVGYFGQICLLPLVDRGVLPKGVPIFNVENACATGSMALHGVGVHPQGPVAAGLEVHPGELGRVGVGEE